MKDKLETCFICGEKYNPKTIKKIDFFDGAKRQSVSRLDYKGHTIPLCNKCFRTLVTSLLMHSHWQIDFEGKNGRTK